MTAAAAAPPVPRVNTTVKPDPTQYQKLVMAGLTHAKAKRWEEASQALFAAAKLAPGAAPAWRVLGDVRHAAGDVAGGNAGHLRAAQASAAEPRMIEAARAIAENRPEAAHKIVAERLKTEPTNVLAIKMMGDLAVRAERNEDAIKLYAQAVKLAPGFAPAWQSFAETLHRIPAGEGLAEVERRLAREPGNMGYRNLKAAMLDRVRDYDGVVAELETIIAEQPKVAGARLTLGHAYKTVGRIDEAVAAYREAIALDPDHGEAYWALADLKDFRFTAEDVAEIRALLADSELPEATRLPLQFALGRALETGGDQAGAFAAYAAGNAIRRKTLRHDPSQVDREIEHAAAVFTPEFFAERKGWGHPSDEPIFIVGMPRSGSSLVEQILASHPAIEGANELQDIPGIVRRLAVQGARDKSGAFPEMLKALTQAQVTRLGQEYLDSTRTYRRDGRQRFIDKLPANFRVAGFIKLILPNARIIDVRRDPMACGYSIFRQNFAGGYSFAASLPDIGSYYAGYVRMMALWDRVLPGEVLRIDYETLVADLEGETRRLLDHLGLPFDPACLAFHETQRAVRTPSATQVRHPIYSEAVDGWRAFAPWLGPLRDSLGDLNLDTAPTRLTAG